MIFKVQQATPPIHTLILSCILVFALTSCRSTVPQPSRILTDKQQSQPYLLQNTAPTQTLNAKSIHFVDLNHDGHLDLLAGGHTRSSSFQVLWGDGTGNWKEQSGPVTTMQPLAFATADTNKNKLVDIIIGGKGEQKGLQIWEYHAQQQHWKLLSSPTLSGTFSGIKFADINHDGWDDIIATRLDNAEGGVAVFLNDGQGGWRSGLGPSSQGVFTDVAVEDINGDGNLDIIATRRGGLGAKHDHDAWSQVGGIHIWYGDGNVHWKPHELATHSDAESLSVTDIDGDGDLDIITGLYLKGITYWINHNNQWHKMSLTQNGTWSSLRVGDLNGDGIQELVAASSVGSGLHIWHWQNGRFIQNNTLTPQFGSYFDVTLGDIYNDGTLAVAATRIDAGVEIWSSKKAPPLPSTQSKGNPIGHPFVATFDTASTLLTPSVQNGLKHWLASLDSIPDNLLITLHATSYEHIHSDLYPSSSALSRARAQKVSQWLKQHGIEHTEVRVMQPERKELLTAANNHGFVKLQAFALQKVKLPASISNYKSRNLYAVEENQVFKTIDGIAEYKVGAGDELKITFWRGAKPDIQKVLVHIDGTISLPYQAALQVNAKTPREIDALITGILKKYERNPRVDVVVLKARSKYASIFGEVKSLTRQPTGAGTYNLQGKETLVEFLSRAGGPTKSANLSAVQVMRGGKTIIADLNRVIQQGDTTEDIIIDHGDSIFIPSLEQSKRQVYVLGEVNKKGIVKFTGNMNFLDAISQSGGLTPDAYLPDIRIIRANREQPEILAVDFERFMEQGDLTQNLTLMDKDIIIVPSRPIANWNKYIADISPTISLLLQPVSIAQQILTLRVLSGQIQ